MRTSRIARETAQITKLLSPNRKRQTRSSRASSASAKLPSFSETVNGPEDEDDTSSISSVQSDYSLDDSKAQLRSGKRKRNETSPRTQPSATAITSVSVKTRTSPRKKTIKVEENVDIEEAGIPKPKKARKQPAKQKVDPSTGDVVIHPPPNWEEVYKTTQEMRKLVQAPVDTMGCERAGDQARSPKVGTLLRCPHLLAKLPLLAQADTIIYVVGWSIPNPHRPHVVFTNQRHHQCPHHGAVANRASSARLNSFQHS